jgi:hypothetical protein
VATHSPQAGSILLQGSHYQSIVTIPSLPSLLAKKAQQHPAM